MNKSLFILLLLINIIVVFTAGIYRVNVNSDSYLNVRSGPGTGYSIVNSLKRNKYIYVTSISNGWAKFYRGYVSTSYIVKVTKGTNYRTTDDLNFRVGPSTSYNIITTLKKGTTVTYFARDPWNDGWGITNRGYCSMNYLKKVTTTTSKSKTSTSKPKASSTKSKASSSSIILNTKRIVQKGDYRVYHQASGATLDYSGCLVCSLTMAYNQIYNKKLDAIQYANRFMQFSGRGNADVYGNGFTNVYPATLDNVLNYLKQKKTVIYGSWGSNSHFVAVYGYTGNYKKPLKSSDFLIHDPYNSYTRLSQHINTHPNSPQIICK